LRFGDAFVSRTVSAVTSLCVYLKGNFQYSNNLRYLFLYFLERYHISQSTKTITCAV
jgi:hypothetical protein